VRQTAASADPYGVSACIIMYVAIIPKGGSVKILGTSLRKENSNSCLFYGNN
jgi:hypothetical protein